MTSTIGDAVKREDTFVVTKIMQAHQIAKEKKVFLWFYQPETMP
jgi:hypothetical protein